MSVAPDSGSSGSGSSFNPLSVGVLGAGALGVGALLAEGPGQLPAEFGTLDQNASWETATGENLQGTGQAMVAGGQSALTMAQNGQLTPEQQAQLSVYQSGLTNTARQTYASMGRNPDQDTSYIQTQGNIDTQVNAMAQQQIQSTIQLGLGEVSGGNSLISAGGADLSAANSALIAAGNAQIQLDQQYSSSLTSAFTAIGNMAATVGKVALVSDIRMKRNITEVGSLFDGTPVYRFQYLNDPVWQIGVMAQDIETFAPHAVIEIGGIKHVDLEKATERALHV